MDTMRGGVIDRAQGRPCAGYLYGSVTFFREPCRQAIGDQRRPAGLMFGPETAPVVTVKIFVEEELISPERIVGKAA